MEGYYSVNISRVEPTCEIPILVTKEGIATNKFADGIVGVPARWRKIAEWLFDPFYDPFIEI